jgi:hypothetical protein
MGPQVLAFPVVVEEVVQEVRLRLLLARQEQTEAVEVAVQQPGEDMAVLREAVAQVIPVAILEDTLTDKAGQAVF